MSGTVMRKNTVIGPAPSSLAASYTCAGIFCSAARNMIMFDPTPCHTVMSVTDASAVLEWDSHVAEGSPIALRMLFRSP